MNRKYRPSLRAHLNRSAASSSFTPRSKTELILIGLSPAARAADIPAKTSSIRSRNVISLNRVLLKVSKLILIRSSPASTRGLANCAKARPFVVMDNRGAFVMELIRATISTISGRSKGSPPVRRISSIPSETADSITVISSSVVKRLSFGSQAAKSCGIQ